MKTVIYKDYDDLVVYDHAFTLPVGSEVEYQGKIHTVSKIKFVHELFKVKDNPAIIHVIE